MRIPANPVFASGLIHARCCQDIYGGQQTRNARGVKRTQVTRTTKNPTPISAISEIEVDVWQRKEGFERPTRGLLFLLAAPFCTLDRRFSRLHTRAISCPHDTPAKRHQKTGISRIVSPLRNLISANEGKRGPSIGMGPSGFIVRLRLPPYRYHRSLQRFGPRQCALLPLCIDRAHG